MLEPPWLRDGVICLYRLWVNEPPVMNYVAEREQLNKLEISHGKRRKGKKKGQFLREEKRTAMSRPGAGGQGAGGDAGAAAGPRERGRAEPPLPPSRRRRGPAVTKREGERGGGAGPGGAGRAARPPRAVPGGRSRERGAAPPSRPPPSLSPGRLPPQRWLPAASGAGAERGAGDAMGVGEEMAAAAAARRPPGLLSRSRSSQPTAPMTAQAARSSQHGHRPQPAPHSASQPPAAPTHRSMPGPRPARRTPAAPARPQGRYLGGLAASTSSAPRPPRARPRQTRRRLRPALTGLRRRPGPHREPGSAQPPLPGSAEGPGQAEGSAALLLRRNTRGAPRSSRGGREGAGQGRDRRAGFEMLPPVLPRAAPRGLPPGLGTGNTGTARGSLERC